MKRVRMELRRRFIPLYCIVTDGLESHRYRHQHFLESTAKLVQARVQDFCPCPSRWRFGLPWHLVVCMLMFLFSHKTQQEVLLLALQPTNLSSAIATRDCVSFIIVYIPYIIATRLISLYSNPLDIL